MAGDTVEGDAEMMAAMGFSGFGMQGKKRKYDAQQDAFVDPSASASKVQAKSSGANSLALGKPREAGEPYRSNAQQSEAPLLPGLGNPSSPGLHSGYANLPPKPGSAMPEATSAGEPTLEALRNGVRNADGDMVIFLPSSIEDPWQNIKRDGR